MKTIESLTVGDRFIHPVSGEIVEVLKKDKALADFSCAESPIWIYWIKWQINGIDKCDYFYDFRLVEQV